MSPEAFRQVVNDGRDDNLIIYIYFDEHRTISFGKRDDTGDILCLIVEDHFNSESYEVCTRNTSLTTPTNYPIHEIDPTFFFLALLT